ncbi:MAG: hypothetical protein ACYSUT_11365 [Planctomycetota bacterium]|jgi:hypothetical protein
MKATLFICTVLVLSLLAGSSALAGRQWYYQPVDTFSGTPVGGHTAIGMRSSHAWPVVMTSDGAAAMVPGGWNNTGMPSRNGDNGYIDAATSSDGQSMIFADSFGHVQTFGPSGWNETFLMADPWTPHARNSVAYSNQSQAAVLYRQQDSGNISLAVQGSTGWSTSSLERWADGYALAYDSYNQANVALSDGDMLFYGTKGVLTNNVWQFSEPIAPPFDFRVGDVLDLELTANDIPYVAFTDDAGMLSYATYDRIQGQWQTGIIDEMMSMSNFCMTSDQEGGIGIAYVMDTYNGFRLGFAHNDGSGLWDTDLLPQTIFDEWGNPIEDIQIDPHFSIGLAFDEANNPIISFSDHGETWIAYDPVPEPATCLLLLLGGIKLLPSRKKA